MVSDYTTKVVRLEDTPYGVVNATYRLRDAYLDDGLEGYTFLKVEDLGLLIRTYVGDERSAVMMASSVDGKTSSPYGFTVQHEESFTDTLDALTEITRASLHELHHQHA